MIESLKQKATALKKESYALYFAARDPRIPWYSKALIGLIVAYAFSPIDLIPDFFPVLGYLDDLVLIPLGIALAIKMIPDEIMTDARDKVETLTTEGKPVIRYGAFIILSLWLVFLLLAGFLIWRIVRK